MAVEKGKMEIHPAQHDILTSSAAESGSNATNQFSEELNGQSSLLDHVKMKNAPSTSNGVSKTRLESSSPLAAGTTLQRKIDAMEPPDKKAKSYQSLTQATIVLSVIFCCWPYNGLLLFAVFQLSRMVVHRNEEKDYMSAQTNSYIVLVCNLIALIFGSIATLAIFITVLYYVSKAIHDGATATDTPAIPTRAPFPPFFG